MSRKLAIIAIAVAFIGLVAALVILSRSSVRVSPWQTTTTVNVPTAKQNAPVIQTGTVPSLSIDSPQPAGDTIIVAKVALPVHGFVVIRDASSNKIVGASNVILFPETMNMKINATVVKGHSYLAEIHADGDNNGIFDPKLDPPFIVNGKTVSAAFKVK